jgi:hypothetical protein
MLPVCIRFCLHPGIALRCMRAGDLMTISKRLYVSGMYPSGGRQLSVAPEVQESYARSLQKSPQHSKQLRTTIPFKQKHVHSKRDVQHSTAHGRQLTSTQDATVPGIQNQAPKRYLTPTNQVVGGFFFHHTRHKEVVSCLPRFSQKLTHACHYFRAAGQVVRGAQTNTECRRLLHACTGLKHVS